MQEAPETMAVQGAPDAMAVLGALEAMAEGPYGRGLVPLGPATTAGALLTPPPRKIHGVAYGVIRSPPGLNTGTGLPTRTGSPAWAKLGS